MFVGCPVINSAFPPHKTMDKRVFPNPNQNPNLPIQRQIGIVSLLGSDTNKNINHHSIKRTLSADMSSPKWVQNNSFSSCPVKRAQSSDRLDVAVEQEEDSDKDKLSHEHEKKGTFKDIWSSILSQKESGSGSGSGLGQFPPPYEHPIVKRTTSSLSEKSLEICTESLGSETGSDGLSFLVGSEPEGTETKEKDEHEYEEHVQESLIISDANSDGVDELDHVGFAKGSVSPTLSLSLGSRLRSSFPPPLPSLASRSGRSNVHMRSRRENGRLVLEAVALPSQNCFKAQRHDGRLVLTIVGDDDDVESCKDDLELEEDVLDYGDKDQEVEEKEDGSCLNFPMEMVSMQQETTPTLIMSKFKCLNSTRPRNVNAPIIDDRAEVDQHKSLLPPRPKMARAISKDGPMSTTTSNFVLNSYEYYWRQTTMVVAMLKPLPRQQNLTAASQVVEERSNYMSKLLLGQEKQEVVVVKAIETKAMKEDQREKEGEYLVPFLRSCKEPKRSLLLWEPCFIATS